MLLSPSQAGSLLRCCKEELTTSHSNSHPGMEVTHRDRLARHA